MYSSLIERPPLKNRGFFPTVVRREVQPTPHFTCHSEISG